MLRKLPDGTGLEWIGNYDRLQIQSWGQDGLRVRGRRRGPCDHSRLNALLPLPAVPRATSVTIDEAAASVRNGAISAHVDSNGLVRFMDSKGDLLLQEEPAHFFWPGARNYLASSGGRTRLEQRFASDPNERVYGLGQHQHGRLNQRGLVVDLVHRICEIAIPFALSSRGYGFLWNTPAIGRVELAGSATKWVSDAGEEIDYWITAGSPAAILARYADVTGHCPDLPAFASGFWQSKLRYRTQAELLSVAHTYHSMGLPLSVIVIDFFHWTRLGDWDFDPADWPDPVGMVKELASLGTRLMVSIWPSLSTVTRHHREMAADGLLIANQRGTVVHAPWPDKGTPEGGFVSYYDATNPAAREYVWEHVRQTYYQHGIRLFWLDACEPEIHPEDHANLLYHAGPGDEVGCRYPLDHARTFYEGLTCSGETDIITLCRSAWAGSQRYGVAVWSGDIQPTFAALRAQIPAGLNMALSGIPWWTTDIGGFHGGDPGDPEYRELVIRWFQYAVFCPLMRLHGDREPRQPFGPYMTGGANEVWAFGEETIPLLVEQLRQRERLRPYLHALMAIAADTGMPPMRPLFLDYPRDPGAWHVEDQFLFGPYLLIAPIAAYQQRARDVYLPTGARWIDSRSGRQYDGGRVIVTEAPITSIPTFVRLDAPADLHAALIRGYDGG